MPNDSSSIGLHTSRLEKDPARKALIDALAERFYVNERGVHISNGLSTDFILFPSDLLAGREGYLNLKIRNAMAYAAAFSDVKEINALLYIPKYSPSYSLVIGLYLFLADECSRLKTPMTFLSAMREAGATLDSRDPADRETLLNSAMKALDLLGMKESHGKLLKKWAETGEYTINGVHHSGGINGKPLQGAYALLARVMDKGNYISLNRAISYALGNKATAEQRTGGMQELYEHTDALTRSPYNLSLRERIEAVIKKGDEARMSLMLNVIEEDKTQHPHKAEISKGDDHYARIGKNMFANLPDAALEILYREGYSMAYADDISIKNSYPDVPLPGQTEDNRAFNSGNKGLRHNRYRILYLSNGEILDREKYENDPHLRTLSLTQTLMHEITHIAISYLTGSEYQQLKQAVEALHENLKTVNPPAPSYLYEAPPTMPDKAANYQRTLKKLLDFKSDFYNGYDEKDSNGQVYKVISEKLRADEIICNVAGFMVSDFPYPPAPDSPAPNPYNDIPALKVLADKINETLAVARKRCQEEYKYVDLPQPTQKISSAAK